MGTPLWIGYVDVNRVFADSYVAVRRKVVTCCGGQSFGKEKPAHVLLD